MPGAGLEPARPFERGILNPLCLPISPPGQTTFYYFNLTTHCVMEAGPGVEPRWTDLQSAAWPLCQPAIQTILLFERVGASNEVRTRDLDLGKVALYQLSYTRVVMAMCLNT